jgi:hypothetical protein
LHAIPWSDSERAAINSLTALLRLLGLDIDARKPLTDKQIALVADWSEREEDIVLRTGRRESGGWLNRSPLCKGTRSNHCGGASHPSHAYMKNEAIPARHIARKSEYCPLDRDFFSRTNCRKPNPRMAMAPKASKIPRYKKSVAIDLLSTRR